MTRSDLEGRASAGDSRVQVRLAAQLDQQGRHAEATDCLARASKAGDVEALTLLGLRLVAGLNAPFRPLDGARLLGDAAAAGGADAAERLAVLIGGGFHVKQNWQAALDCLQRSAELGSQSAQSQLRILAGASAKSGATTSPDTWPALRAAVDPEAWTKPAPTEQLSASPLVQCVRELIAPAVCAWVIEQSRPRLTRAELYDPDTGRPMLSTQTRLNRIANFDLAQTSLLNLLIQARISAATGIASDRLESFSVLHYAVGEEYGDHVDYLDPDIPSYAAEIARMGQRVATCLVYLNGGYDGGETEFPGLGIRHKGGAGDALIFHSADPAGIPDRRTVHAGRPLIAGEKWVLSQFARNRVLPGRS